MGRGVRRRLIGGEIRTCRGRRVLDWTDRVGGHVQRTYWKFSKDSAHSPISESPFVDYVSSVGSEMLTKVRGHSDVEVGMEGVSEDVSIKEHADRQMIVGTKALQGIEMGGNWQWGEWRSLGLFLLDSHGGPRSRLPRPRICRLCCKHSNPDQQPDAAAKNTSA